MMRAVAAQINKALKQIRQPLFALVARGGSRTLQLKGFAEETLQEVELFSKSALTLTSLKAHVLWLFLCTEKLHAPCCCNVWWNCRGQRG